MPAMGGQTTLDAAESLPVQSSPSAVFGTNVDWQSHINHLEPALCTNWLLRF